MSDDNTKDPQDAKDDADAIVSSITDYVPKTRRTVGKDGRVPASMRGVQAARDQQDDRPATVKEVREWITAGSLAAGSKVYRELGDQHKAVFEMQEAAFMVVLESLHDRLAIIEESQGLATPDRASIRAAFESAIVEYQNAGAGTDDSAEPTPERITAVREQLGDHWNEMSVPERRAAVEASMRASTSAVTELDRGEPSEDLSGRAKLIVEEQSAPVTEG